MREFGLVSGINAALAENLVSSIIFVIIGALSYRYLYAPAKRRLNVLTRLLPLEINKTPIVLCYGLVTAGHSGKYYMVEDGDHSAINLASEMLADNYGRSRVQVLNHLLVESRLFEVEDVVSISGPRWNRVTEAYIGRLGSPIRFSADPEGVAICDELETKEILETTYGEGGEPAVDYGFVIAGCVKTVEDRVQHIVVCAGMNNLATYGSIVFLNRLRYHKRKKGVEGLDLPRSKNRWGIVLRVANLTNPQHSVYRPMPVNRSHLRIDIVRTFPDSEFLVPYSYRY